MRKRAVLGSLAGYVVNHPQELLRAARNAVRWRFGLPIAALRWLASEFGNSAAVSELELEAVPPGMRLRAKLRVMNTALKAAADLYVDRIVVDETQLRFELRLGNVELTLLGDSETPLGTLVRSGALDLRKPGNLLRYMPKRPAFLVDAADDRIVIDLARLPALRGKTAGQILRLVTPLVTLSAIETDPDHIDFALKPLKDGWQAAWRSLLNGERGDGAKRGQEN